MEPNNFAPRASAEAERAYVEPRGPVEEALSDIFAQVLKVERVGVHDSFFDLGGHSLLATQVIARVRDAFKVDLPLHGLFAAPAPSALAATVLSLLQAGHGVEAPPIGRASATSPSFAQERLWFLAELEPGDL